MLRIDSTDAISFLKTLDDNSVDCVVTSPPYLAVRDYKTDGYQWESVTYSPILGMDPITVSEWKGELGSEPTVELYVGHLLLIFREVYRVLKKTGVFWLNLGDKHGRVPRPLSPSDGKRPDKKRKTMFETEFYGKSKAVMKEKSLAMVPARVALALQSEGWILRSDCIWFKPNPLPGSQEDRFTTNHEYVFQLVKSKKYYFDMQAVAEPVAESTPARNKRGVSAVHKMVNGAPGQTKHSMNQPRENVKSAQLNHDGESKRIPYPTRSKRSVMIVSTVGSSYDFCRCGRLYLGSERKRIREERLDPETGKLRKYMTNCLNCGQKDQYVAHFAPYPPKLITPLIKAGCPEMVCSTCGTPYRRIVRKVGSNWEERKANGAPMRYGMNNNKGQGPTNYGGSTYVETAANDGSHNKEPYQENNPHRMRLEEDGIYMDYGDSVRKRASAPGSEITSKTSVFRTGKTPIKESSGWQKMCQCDIDQVKPGIVCDPFLGSGITVMTALSLDRDFIGCEINPDYVSLSHARIARWREDPQFRNQYVTVDMPQLSSNDSSPLNGAGNGILGSSKPVQINLFGDDNGTKI